MCAASPTSASLSPMNVRAVNRPSGNARRGPDHFQLAEAQAETLFQFGVEFRIGQRDDPFGLARVFGPYDRASLAGQRQDCEGPGREKMFFRATFMIALVPTVVTIADWS